LQIRKDFLCFCIGYCFGDASLSDMMLPDKEVIALMQIKVNRMLEIYGQHLLTDEELVNFTTVKNWIKNLQVQLKRNGINTESNK